MRWSRCLAGVVLGGCLATPSRAALPLVPVLPAQAALAMAQAALAACHGGGYRVAVAIVDPAGTLRVLIADDGAKAIDIDAARRKAESADTLGARTAAIADAVAASPAFGRVLEQLRPNLLLVGGGVPIMAASTAIGAIGVGGAAGGDKDEACANAGLGALKSYLR